MIRAPRLCRVPDCCGEAIGRCTVDVDWQVCWWHFPLAKNNGFAPLTWAELQERRERWSAEKVGADEGAGAAVRRGVELS